jgi:hypothetical protein
MPSWTLKAAATGVASRLPGSETLPHLWRKHVPGAAKLGDRLVVSKFERCREHLEHYRRHVGPGMPAVLELGTGWFPIASLGFALSGAERVWSIDRRSHLRLDDVTATIDILVRLARGGALQGVQPERLARLEDARSARSPAAILEAAGVTCLLGDARRIDVGAPVDLVVSNNTLEHIPPTDLREMFLRWRGLLAAGGLMSHWIDLSDHYADFDPGIGPYHFLKFSAPVWRLLNNDLLYQNRLRASDYRRLHAETGWTLVEERHVSGEPAELRKIRLAPEFAPYTEADLLVRAAWMVARAA